MYNSATFIETYDPSDYVLSFIDISGRRIKSINVCRYLNTGVDSNIIWVLLEGNEKIILDFTNALDANSAATNLKNAIDALASNCPIGGSSSPLPSQTLTIRSVTVAQYEVLRAAGELTDTVDADKVQWYDVSDTGNLFGEGAGSVFRVLALWEEDGQPIGFCVNTLKTGVLDFDLHKFQNSYEDVNYELTLNNSRITNSSTTPSTQLIAINESSIITSGVASEKIYANNSINLTVTECLDIFAYKCGNLTLRNARYCIFENISGDLASYPYFNIRVHPYDTIGKLGHGSLKTGNVTLQSYIDYIYQTMFPTGSGDITLVNTITQANATFNLIVPSGYTGLYNVIDYDSSSILLTIDSSYEGLTLTFVYNKVTGEWYYEKKSEATKQSTSSLTVAVLGQTIFVDVLDYIPKKPSLSQLFVNGHKQVYAVDYNIVNRTVVWTNFSFTLDIDDYIEIYYE